MNIIWRASCKHHIEQLDHDPVALGSGDNLCCGGIVLIFMNFVFCPKTLKYEHQSDFM